MTDLQFRDLASAAGFAAAAYALFNVLISFGSGRPVAEWINPHRRYLLSLAAVLAVGAYTLLYRAGLKYHAPVGELLSALVREERAKPEVVGAASFLLLAVTLLPLYGWCRWLYPRDPATFSPGAADLRAEYRRAMRHYARWSGQIDYTALFLVGAGGVEKIAAFTLPARTVFRRMARVDSMRVPPDADVGKTTDDQFARWDAFAARCFERWNDLDTLVAPARQGENVLILFDAQFGGVFVELLQEFAAADGGKVRAFLVAACLDQHGIDSATTARDYAMLSRAIRHVRSGGAKAGG